MLHYFFDSPRLQGFQRVPSGGRIRNREDRQMLLYVQTWLPLLSITLVDQI
jgi:hypothetical protein